MTDGERSGGSECGENFDNATTSLITENNATEPRASHELLRADPATRVRALQLDPAPGRVEVRQHLGLRRRRRRRMHGRLRQVRNHEIVPPAQRQIIKKATHTRTQGIRQHNYQPQSMQHMQCSAVIQRGMHINNASGKPSGFYKKKKKIQKKKKKKGATFFFFFFFFLARSFQRVEAKANKN
jgi:hypothetical protein